MSAAKRVVEPDQATRLTQPADYVEPSPTPPVASVPAVPAFTFRSRLPGLVRMEIAPDVIFAFSPGTTWSTADLVLGAQIAAVADKYAVEVISSPAPK